MAFDECTEHPAERERARGVDGDDAAVAEAESRDYFEAHKEEVVWFGRQLSVAGGQLPVKSNADSSNRSEKLAQDDNRGEVDDPTLSQKRGKDGAPTDRRGERGPSTTATEALASAQDDNVSEIAPGQTQALFGIVQGGMYPDLRRESAERTVEIDLPGYAIGGLSVGEPRPLTYEMVDAAMPYLPQNKPRYLMGVGTPEEIVHYVAQGVDMMDCVLADTRGAARTAVYVRRQVDDQECAVCAG